MREDFREPFTLPVTLQVNPLDAHELHDQLHQGVGRTPVVSVGDVESVEERLLTQREAIAFFNDRFLGVENHELDGISARNFRRIPLKLPNRKGWDRRVLQLFVERFSADRDVTVAHLIRQMEGWPEAGYTEVEQQ